MSDQQDFNRSRSEEAFHRFEPVINELLAEGYSVSEIHQAVWAHALIFAREFFGIKTPFQMGLYLQKLARDSFVRGAKNSGP